MLDGVTYVAKSTSKLAPLRRIDQLSHRERNKIEKMAHKHGVVYVLDIWDGQGAFVVLRGGEWPMPDEWNDRQSKREDEAFRSGAWLMDVLGEDDIRKLADDADR